MDSNDFHGFANEISKFANFSLASCLACDDRSQSISKLGRLLQLLDQCRKNDVINRTFVAQLTDTHCRYLATLRNDGDVRNYITFLDGDEFLPNWGFGEDNCGNETNLAVKGDIQRTGTVVTSANKDFLLDIVI